MDNLLIAGAAEEEYTASLRWYAERSKRTAEGFEADFRGALESISLQSTSRLLVGPVAR